MVLRPKAIRREQAMALLEVSNRGGKAVLPYFAVAAWSTDPVSDADFGDGLPLRLGLTLIWVGWQFDVATRDGTLRLDAPVATDGGRSIEGLVRSDWTVDERVATLSLGHRGHRPYPIANADDPANVLTERDGRLAARRVVPREQWRFVDQGTRIARNSGFEPGKIYELVYRARDPVVVGMGLAARRGAPTRVRRPVRAHGRRGARKLQPSLRAALPRRPSPLLVLLSDRPLPVQWPRSARSRDGGPRRLARPRAAPPARLLHQHRLRVLGSRGFIDPHHAECRRRRRASRQRAHLPSRGWTALRGRLAARPTALRRRRGVSR